MARIPEVTQREQIPDAQRHIFDAIAESRGGIRGPFGVLLNSPELAGRVAHLGSYVRFNSVLSPEDRELAIILTAHQHQCDMEWWAHTRLARQAGVAEQAIEAVDQEGPLEGLSKSAAIIIRYGRELHRDNRVSGETFRAAEAHFGRQGVLELTATMGYYAMLAAILNALDVAPPGP